MKAELIKRIRTRNARIAVVGLGRVGLPTAVMFADAGYEVIGVDVKKERVDAILSTKPLMKEEGLDELLKKVIGNGTLRGTTNAVGAVKEADVTVICVQTPVNEDGEPNLAYLQAACESVAKGLSKGKLVIVESTVPPGLTKNLVAKKLEEWSKLKCGKDFWLVCCPETMAPGNALQEFVKNPRIIGGYDHESAKMAVELFKMVTKGKIAITDSTSAEVAKLAGNTFRDVNIAFANELSLICEQIGVDVTEVIKLVSMHPRAKNIHRPGPGVGGPCLTKDPYLLLDSVKEKNLKLRVMKSSRDLNDRMPGHIAELVVKALKEAKKDVQNSKVAILGVAYKGEVDDATASPAEKIIHKLIRLRAKVLVYDPYSEEIFGAKKAKSIEEAVEGADCLVIVTDHKMFKKLELRKIKTLMKENPAIIDGRRIVNSVRAKKFGFRYLGTGYIDR